MRPGQEARFSARAAIQALCRARSNARASTDPRTRPARRPKAPRPPARRRPPRHFEAARRDRVRLARSCSRCRPAENRNRRLPGRRTKRHLRSARVPSLRESDASGPAELHVSLIQRLLGVRWVSAPRPERRKSRPSSHRLASRRDTGYRAPRESPRRARRNRPHSGRGTRTASHLVHQG